MGDINVVKKFQLKERLSSLREWKSQVDNDLDRFEREMLKSAAESVKLESAIQKLEDELRSLLDES